LCLPNEKFESSAVAATSQAIAKNSKSFLRQGHQRLFGFSRNHARSFDAMKARRRGMLGWSGDRVSKSARIFLSALRTVGQL
jgi:hypothetical protein